MNFHIAILEDDADVRAYIASLARRWAEERAEGLHLRAYESAEQFLFAGENAKILLLDVEMGGMNGVELARRLRKTRSDMQIIFITAHPDYMSEGYEVEAVNYLLKPVQRERLFSALDRATERLAGERPTILVNAEDGPVKLYVDEIIYVEAVSHRTQVWTKSGALNVSEPISRLEERLGSAFVRCHRSYLVNLSWIARVTRTEVALDNRHTLPLSRRLAGEVLRSFIDYYRRDEHAPE